MLHLDTAENAFKIDNKPFMNTEILHRKNTTAPEHNANLCYKPVA